MKIKDYKTVILEKNEEGIGTLTLNRPEVFNAISEELTSEVLDALRIVNADADIKVLIITGAGKGFQAGADISPSSPPSTAWRSAGASSWPWPARSASPWKAPSWACPK